jgi:CBS domain-containing protein
MLLSTLATHLDTTAQEIMTENPVSIRDEATLNEAISFLIDKGFRAAPVIDASGRPVGVISQSDIVTHDRELISGGSRHGYYQADNLAFVRKDTPGTSSALQVRDMMTPAVFQVPTTAKLSRVVEEMVALNVHRLFVVGPDRVLVGVITALDVLRHVFHQLRRESADVALAPAT